MASIDSDSEVQFDLHHEVNEEGQGDVHLHQSVPMEKPDNLPDDAPPKKTPQHYKSYTCCLLFRYKSSRCLLNLAITTLMRTKIIQI